MSYEQKDEPNEKKPGGNNPKKNFWTPLIIALALVLLFGWIYNMVSDSQYTETTYADFYTAMGIISWPRSSAGAAASIT